MDLGLTLPEGRTRRVDANVAALIAAQKHAEVLEEAQQASRLLSQVNFDATHIPRVYAIDLLRRTIEIAQMTKKKWIEARKHNDDVVLNLDYLIVRCSQDKRRYEADNERAKNQGRANDVGPGTHGEGFPS